MILFFYPLVPPIFTTITGVKKFDSIEVILIFVFSLWIVRCFYGTRCSGGSIPRSSKVLSMFWDEINKGLIDILEWMRPKVLEVGTL